MRTLLARESQTEETSLSTIIGSLYREQDA